MILELGIYNGLELILIVMGGSCEGKATTKPLLTRSIIPMDELKGYRHAIH